MTETDPLRGFTAALLRDVGAEVRDDGTFLWVTVPESAQSSLDLPPQACLTFDPERIGEFDAELVAPGSYLLEKLLGLATQRGRWDLARLATAREDWVGAALGATDRIARDASVRVLDRREEALVLFAFRTALTSDEKREAFHLVAATSDGAEGWDVPWPLPEDGLVPADPSGFAPDLEPAYHRAKQVLLAGVATDLASFQKTALAALEEEVRRIFRYFDGTVAEVRAAAPSGADDVVRAIEAERDRRLAEALERFDPHAAATLCSVRLVLVPTARAVARLENGARVEVRVDALTRRVRGLPEPLTGAGSAPPQARPRSDTPRPRRTADPGTGRSPRESRGQSRSAASRRRGR